MSGTNGTLPKLDDLKEQIRLERARTSLARAKQERALCEGLADGNLGSGYGDLLNPFGYRLDPFGGLWLPMQQGGVSAKRDGKEAPFFQSDADLDKMRGLARWLARKNDIAIGAMNTLRNYTVKKGYDWAERPTKGNEEDARAVELAGTVGRFLKHYDQFNTVRTRERESFTRAVRDGDAIVRHTCLDDGMTAIRLVAAERMRDPGNVGPHCFGGVETPEDDVLSPLHYWITYDDGTSYDPVPPEEISHLKRNVDEEIKRGVSDFYSAGDSFNETRKLLDRLGKGGALLASIPWIEEYENATTGQIQADVQRDLNRPRLQHPLTGRDVDYQHYEPNTVVKIKKGKKYLPPPLAGNTANFAQIVQACLRAVGVRWSMPEYMISGDSSNANYASTMVSGSPFVNAVECEQDDFGLYFLRWRWIAVRNACERGLIRADFAEVEALVDLHYTPPLVAISNEGEQATIDSQDIAAGVLSIQTRRARRKLDNEQEEKNLKELPPTRVSGKATDLDAQGNPVRQDSRGDPTRRAVGDTPVGDGKPDASVAQASVGGLQAILALQSSVYKGEIPREAAIANAEVVFGFAPEQAARLFPEVPPEKTADDGQGGQGGQPIPFGESRRLREGEDADEVDPGVLADLFYGIYGDEALAILRQLGGLSEGWDAASHPRGKGGRFIPKGSAEAVTAAQTAVDRVLGGDPDVDPKELLDHLSILTVKQITALAKKHGKTAPKLLRKELVDAVTQIMGQDAARPRAETSARHVSRSRESPYRQGRTVTGRDGQVYKIAQVHKSEYGHGHDSDQYLHRASLTPASAEEADDHRRRSEIDELSRKLSSRVAGPDDARDRAAFDAETAAMHKRLRQLRGEPEPEPKKPDVRVAVEAPPGGWVGTPPDANAQKELGVAAADAGVDPHDLHHVAAAMVAHYGMRSYNEATAAQAGELVKAVRSGKPLGEELSDEIGFSERAIPAIMAALKRLGLAESYAPDARHEALAWLAEADWLGENLREAREKGVPFQGPSGRWFVVNDKGRTVPARNPNAQAPAKKAPKAAAAKSDKQPKRTPAEKVAAAKQAVEEHRKAGDHAALTAHLATLSVAEIGALKKDLGIKASGAKAELAKKVAERAIAGAGKAKGAPQPKTGAKWPPDDAARESASADDLDKAQPWLKALYKESTDFLKAAPPAQSQALKDYSGGEHQDVNQVLREGRADAAHPGTKEIIDNLDGLFASAKPFAEPRMVYRGLKMSPGKRAAFFDSMAKAAASGESVEFPEYLSTTISTTMAESFTQLHGTEDGPGVEIMCKKGIYARPKSRYPDEEEVLINRGSKFRVVGVKTVSWNGKPRQVVQLEQES